MIDDEAEAADKMQGNHEASLGCLKANGSQCNIQEKGNEGFPDPKDKKNNHLGDKAFTDKVLWEASPPPNHGYSSPFYRQEVLTWPYVYPDYQIQQQSQPHAFDNRLYPMNRDYNFPVENQAHFVPFKMFPQCYPHDVQLQQFQYFVVIDFEATCDKDKNPHPQEIIEFPSVLVNSATGQLEASFQTYVRPTYHQHLTNFCKELTGIQQIQVDRGVPLSEALLMHDKWLENKGIKHKNFAVVTWSNWDCRVMLESECRFKRIRKPPYFNRWINLKVPFQEVFGGIRCNLKEAVQLAGLAWEGRAHCGLDDALNTARLLALLMHRGFQFSITNTLVWHSAAQPTMSWQSPGRPSDASQQLPKPKDPMGLPGPFHSFGDPVGKDRLMYCYCGVPSSRCVVRKPGPTQGQCFFGCGNWTATRRAACKYFVWASS